MKSLYTKKVIVTSLALAVMLGGGVLYANKQPALAETTDSAAVQQQTLNAQQKQERLQEKQGAQQRHGKQESVQDRVHFNKQMPILEESSAILGIDKDTLSTALKDKSLVEIAKDKGITEADLIAKLQAARSKKIDEAVQSGKLKADKAEKVKSGMEKHLKFMINHKGSDFSGKHGIKRNSMMPAPEKLSALLGISVDELNAELKEGKSLTEIAQVKGISKDQLIAKIKDEMTPWIDKMVDHKRGSAREKQQTE